jgi:hypothetical protein
MIMVLPGTFNVAEFVPRAPWRGGDYPGHLLWRCYERPSNILSFQPDRRSEPRLMSCT